MTTINRAERRKAKAPAQPLPRNVDPLPDEYLRPDLPARPVKLPDELGGGIIQMRKFTARDYMAIRRRLLTDTQLVELTVSAIREYVPGEDVMDLDPLEILDIMNAWVEGRTTELLPPPTA